MVASTTFGSPEQKWNIFKRDVLIPTTVEAGLLNAKGAQSWKGGCEYKYGREYIYIHNPRSCGWSSIPTFNYNPVNISAFNTTTTHNNYGTSRNETRETDRKKKKEESDQASTAAIVAGVSVCIVAILYTGYQMAHSIAQTLSSSKAFHKMDAAHRGIARIDINDPHCSINDIMEYRTELLGRAYKRNLADAIEDIVIIAGLTLAAFGVGMSYSAPLIASGTVIVVAAIITKFVTKSIWPNLENDSELKDQARQAAADAEWLMNNVSFKQPHPPSTPYHADTAPPLYPNLDTFKEELARDFRTAKTELNFNFNFNPVPSAPPL